MKKLLCLSLLSSVVFMTHVSAQTETTSSNTIPAPVIGLVEQAALDKSDALKSIVSQMEKKRGEVQKEMQTYEKELKDQDQKLTAEQKTLPEKQFAEKRQAFETRVRDIQQKLEIRRAQMEIAFEESKKKVYDAFIKAADEVRTETGANIILYKETVISAANTFDLTPKVLIKLNKTLPSVPVTFKSEAEIKAQIQKNVQVPAQK